MNNDIDFYYKKGLLSKEGMLILKHLEKEGRADVSELRKISNTEGKENKSLFDRAVMELKKSMLIAKIDVIEGGWGTNVFGLTHIAFKELCEEAVKLETSEALNKIIDHLELYNSLEIADFSRSFNFDKNEVESYLEIKIAKGELDLEKKTRQKIYSKI